MLWSESSDRCNFFFFFLFNNVSVTLYAMLAQCWVGRQVEGMMLMYACM